jgi:hypothetical protein
MNLPVLVVQLLLLRLRGVIIQTPFYPSTRYISHACIHISNQAIHELLNETSASTLNASLYASNKVLTLVLSDTNASSSNNKSANRSGL